MLLNTLIQYIFPDYIFTRSLLIVRNIIIKNVKISHPFTKYNKISGEELT